MMFFLKEYNMASCRICGGELQQIAMCPVCEENVQWKCVSCNKETDRSVHVHDGKIVMARIISITTTTDVPIERESPAASSSASSAAATM